MRIIKDKNRINGAISIKNTIIFFILFSLFYWLLNYIFNGLLHFIYRDVFNHIHDDNNKQAIFDSLLEHNRWSRKFKPFILLIILSSSCIGILFFKRKYFKECLISFVTFILALFILNFLIKTYNNNKQEKDNNLYTKLIVGKWDYRSSTVGNVYIVFNKDKSGLRFADSIKTIQKFHYIIVGGLYLSIYFDSNKDEFYSIDSLTTKTLSIRPGPFTKGNIYVSNFKRDTGSVSK